MADSKPELTKLDAPERSRTYHFGDTKIRVENVTAVCVRSSGTHRLETSDGRKWIIPPGWFAVELDMDEWTFRGGGREVSNRTVYKIRRCRKETTCTEATWHTIRVNDLYLYGACPPGHEFNDGKRWWIIRACLRCAARNGMHNSDTRKQLERVMSNG